MNEEGETTGSLLIGAAHDEPAVPAFLSDILMRAPAVSRRLTRARGDGLPKVRR